MVSMQSAPHSMLLSKSAHSRIHPNPARIIGVASAVTLNAALLMLALVPVDLPMPRRAIDSLIVVPIFQPIKPPEKPPVVEVTKPRTEVPPRPVHTRSPVPPMDPAPVITDQGSPVDLPVEPAIPDAGPADVIGTHDRAPLAGVRLEYATAPAPSYPRRAIVERAEGQVLLRVLVDVDGTPLDVTIHRSSGHRELDRAATQQVLRHWKFRPAMKDGRAIQAIGIIPIDFKLQ